VAPDHPTKGKKDRLAYCGKRVMAYGTHPWPRDVQRESEAERSGWRWLRPRMINMRTPIKGKLPAQYTPNTYREPSSGKNTAYCLGIQVHAIPYSIPSAAR
jgi:hypothetical protein